jgi:site-specific recombinase XerD
MTAQGWSLRSQAGQRKYLNSDERARFLVAAQRVSPEVRTFCLTLVYTGCRVSEALNLTGADIELTSGLIAIRSLKKRHVVAVREIPVPSSLLDELAEVHSLSAMVSYRLWPWGRTRGWQAVKRVMNEAGISSLPASPKGLRHAFGVHAVLSGVPLNLIQKWLGHADIATTAIYTNVLGPEERRVAERMWLR